MTMGHGYCLPAVCDSDSDSGTWIGHTVKKVVTFEVKNTIQESKEQVECHD